MTGRPTCRTLAGALGEVEVPCPGVAHAGSVGAKGAALLACVRGSGILWSALTGAGGNGVTTLDGGVVRRGTLGMSGPVEKMAGALEVEVPGCRGRKQTCWKGS